MKGSQNNQKEVILEVRDLKTHFIDKDKRIWKILDGINFQLNRGETLGILGPSGAGKSVLARSILKLIDYPGKIVSGEVYFKGKDLFKIPDDEFNNLRGKEISLILQNTKGGMDPIRDMTFTTSQPFRSHTEDNYENYEIKILVINQLGQVAIPNPSKMSEKFAHELSGGESQRIKIASAIINNPVLLIADEPVANLDSTVARQILNLLQIMKEKYHLTMIFIAHNLGVLAEMADKIAILYAGKIIEYGQVDTIFYDPKHPFTQALFYATPSIARKGKLKPIPGDEPDPRNFPIGCRFHPRCLYAVEKCKHEIPPMIEHEKDHFISCWRAKEIPTYLKEEDNF